MPLENVDQHPKTEQQTFISTWWPHSEISARIKTTRPSSLVRCEHVTSQLISADGVFLQDQMFVLTSARHECASHDRSGISRGTLTHSSPCPGSRLTVVMAQAAQINVLDINTPLRVEHDKKRRQFSIRLNGQ